MEHMKERFKALIIDFIVVTLLTALVNNILYIPLAIIGNLVLLVYYPFVVYVLISILYFTIYEGKTNKTIGKRITNLYVSDADGFMSYKKAFIRNLTKLFWIPLIFDVLLGKLQHCPSRLFDKFANTDVYLDKELELNY